MKSIFKSKTFWVNTVAIVGVMGPWAAGRQWVDSRDAAMLLAVANIGLRFVTSTPVSITGNAPAPTQQSPTP